ncbi:hypothetical protein SBA6_700002 [Candidatus Sulfopaludibacter sp. SbA6]|nr:hypothetical protein SBA6_700002 [Candidatus Sulfopaludibacter sp. SbA6]
MWQASAVERVADGRWYDLTRFWGVSLKIKQGEQTLLQGVHVGETGGGGKLVLSLAARVDHQGFADAA